MVSPQEEKPVRPASRAPRQGLLMMAVILIAMTLLAIYSNVQRARRDQIETVTIIPAARSPTSTASPSPAPP